METCLNTKRRIRAGAAPWAEPTPAQSTQQEQEMLLCTIGARWERTLSTKQSRWCLALVSTRASISPTVTSRALTTARVATRRLLPAVADVRVDGGLPEEQVQRAVEAKTGSSRLSNTMLISSTFPRATFKSQIPPSSTPCSWTLTQATIFTPFPQAKVSMGRSSQAWVRRPKSEGVPQPSLSIEHLSTRSSLRTWRDTSRHSSLKISKASSKKRQGIKRSKESNLRSERKKSPRKLRKVVSRSPTSSRKKKRPEVSKMLRLAYSTHKTRTPQNSKCSPKYWLKSPRRTRLTWISSAKWQMAWVRYLLKKKIKSKQSSRLWWQRWGPKPQNSIAGTTTLSREMSRVTRS